MVGGGSGGKEINNGLKRSMEDSRNKHQSGNAREPHNRVDLELTNCLTPLPPPSSYGAEILPSPNPTPPPREEKETKKRRSEGSAAGRSPTRRE